MIIGLNGRKITVQQPAGPEVYTIKLYRSLALIDKTNLYIIFVSVVPSVDLQNYITAGNKNFKFKVINKKFFWTQLWLSLEFYKQKFDVFYSPIHTFPIFMPFTTKIVSMIHGLEHKTNKELSRFDPKFLIVDLLLRITVFRSQAIIVPSDSTKKNLIANYSFTENKIKVIHEGLSEEFSPKSEEECEIFLKKYSLSNKEYLLFVSTIQPRKNLITTIEAFSQIVSENPNLSELKLVICGKPGWNYTDIFDAPRRFGISDKVIFTGFVPQNELPFLFSASLCYLNFSYDEGFGLTVLESMACGVLPVISDIPAHHEVAGNLAIYADPNSLESMTGALNDGLELQSTGKQQELILRASKFTWENTAKQTLSVFENIIKNP